MPAREHIGSARDALRHLDFRRLFAVRILSQSADGLVQAVLVSSIAFAPEQQDTALGFALASAIVIVPFSLLGPLAGVFIDRWPRRRILEIAPLLRAAAVAGVVASPTRQAVVFYASALFVTSVNRFFLATAQAVVPRLVPTKDLLAANAVGTVGGTVALLLGVTAGGLAVDALGETPIVVVVALMWVAAAMLARSIRSDLRPQVLPTEPELLRHELRRVGVEFVDGVRRLGHTPRALGPIVSITIDQIGQGLLLVLAIVVFRDRFEEGVGSFAWLIGASGVGVLLGLATVGALDRRFTRERIVAGAFLFGGICTLAVALVVTRWSVLVASFAVGMAYAWKKIPIDTMVQEALPDRYRGRVFAVYDVLTNMARLFAAFLAIPLLPAVGAQGAAAIVGVVFVLWAPVFPRWIRGAPEIRIRFHEGARAEEWPLAVRWGGVEESVEVVRSATVERDGARLRTFRLALQDGTVLDVSRPEDGGDWAIDRERDLP